MSLESNMASIEINLDRIATALEIISTGGALPKPAASDKPGTTKSAKASKPSPSKVKPTSKPASTKESPATKTNEDGPEIGDVRAALGKVQKAFDPETARAVLKDFGGATTMSKLEKDMYQVVIDAALEKAADVD